MGRACPSREATPSGSPRKPLEERRASAPPTRRPRPRTRSSSGSGRPRPARKQRRGSSPTTRWSTPRGRRTTRRLVPVRSWIPPGPRFGEEVIVAEGLRKEIGDRVLIDDLSFEVPRASVVGIVGANGAGKSTLIKMLTGQEPVTAGEVKVGGTVKLASVDQAREDLDAKGGQSVFEAICGERETLDLGEREVNARAYVSAFGFRSREPVWKSTSASGARRWPAAALARSSDEGIGIATPSSKRGVEF